VVASTAYVTRYFHKKSFKTAFLKIQAYSVSCFYDSDNQVLCLKTRDKELVHKALNQGSARGIAKRQMSSRNLT